MIDWIIAGALAAVLLAEMADAWALRLLVQRCDSVRSRTRADMRLVRWYAEGFEHSMALTTWLGMAGIALTLTAAFGGAHPAVITASLLLTLGALGERRFSDQLRRRFLKRR